jgi:hypothetical protein
MGKYYEKITSHRLGGSDNSTEGFDPPYIIGYPKGVPIMRKQLPLYTLLAAALFLTGCTATQQGSLMGGGIGAASGAIIGHQVGKQGEGALIGGAIGALTGALVGDQIEQERRRAYTTTEVHETVVPRKKIIHKKVYPPVVEHHEYIYVPAPPPPPRRTVIIEERWP